MDLQLVDQGPGVGFGHGQNRSGFVRLQTLFRLMAFEGRLQTKTTAVEWGGLYEVAETSPAVEGEPAAKFSTSPINSRPLIGLDR